LGDSLSQFVVLNAVLVRRLALLFRFG